MKLCCSKCGKVFERQYGIGFTGCGTLYCDRCGKAVPVDFATNPFFDENCSCGGRFTATAMGACPQCGTLLTESDGEEVGQWE